MSRRILGAGGAVLLFLAGIALWGRAVWLSGHLGDAPAYSLLFREEQTLKPEDFFDNKTQYNYAVARQEMAATVEAPQFRRERGVALLEAAGNLSLLLPTQELVTGGYPLDSLGCAIDLESALILWGDPEVVGKTLIYKEKEYTVTGVFRSEHPMLILRPAGELRFRHAVFAPDPAGAFPTQKLDEFLAQEGLGRPALSQNAGERNRFYRQLALLPALIPCGALLWWLTREVFPRRAVLRRGSLLLGLGLAGFLLGIRPRIPAEYLPTRWSDFSFWSSLWKQTRANRLIRATEPGLLVEHLLMQDYLQPILLWTALSALCFLVSSILLCKMNRGR